ncbi:MAG: DUF362 domain-containing protein [Candidatus Lokiarchaeota archaeon]|nr:DUF362 domain-containing protein [Candidatus Lokiarchaeota archaeon]
MKKTKVFLKSLQNDHQNESFTQYKALNRELAEEVEKNIREILEALGGANLLKSSKDVYIKPNGIDAKPYAFTRVEVLASIIKYFKCAGARNIYLFENSTQSNYTRLVFEATGYHKICKKYGVHPIYLDEEKTKQFNFKEPASQNMDMKKKYRSNQDKRNQSNEKSETNEIEKNQYDLKTFAMSKTIVDKLIREKDANLYINVPKLKTHSMGIVTLGIKNQWAFPIHLHRGYDHNYNLHSKLTEVLEIIEPDVTIIDGIEGTIHGHYPATSLADKQVVPFKVLIGGKNVVATDIVGARVFGIKPEEVPHIKIAIERGLSHGVTSLDDIDVIGDLSQFQKKYPYTLIQEFHPDVNIVKGSKLLCPEGCKNNPLTLLQILYFDYNAKGGWDLVIGKGHDTEIIDKLHGPVLIAGHCAIEEVGERLINRLGRSRVYLSGYCNDLAATASAMLRLSKVNVLKLVNVNPLRAIWILMNVKLHKSHAKAPSLFCNLFKMV